MLSREQKDRIYRNLFPAAHVAVGDWDTFPWHLDRRGHPTADLAWSSQALAIDVFGTLRGLESRSAIISELVGAGGSTDQGPWTVQLEWTDPESLLQEPRPTQVDVMCRSARSLVLIECKFTEGNAGSCSQPRRLARGRYKGVRQCSGAFKEQVNPVNGLSASCALTAKGIKYWDWIPDAFGFDNSGDYDPCPFAGPAFQWMRNIVSAMAIGASLNLQPVVLIVYGEGAGGIQLPVQREVASQKWRAFAAQVASGPVILRVLSYRRLLEVALGVATPCDKQRLDQLMQWVRSKELAACERIRAMRAGSHGD